MYGFGTNRLSLQPNYHKVFLLLNLHMHLFSASEIQYHNHRNLLWLLDHSWHGFIENGPFQNIANFGNYFPTLQLGFWKFLLGILFLHY